MVIIFSVRNKVYDAASIATGESTSVQLRQRPIANYKFVNT